MTSTTNTPVITPCAPEAGAGIAYCSIHQAEKHGGRSGHPCLILKTDMLTKILQHTNDDAGCDVWQRGCCNGHPAMRHQGKTQLVRRLIWTEMHGTITPGVVVRMQCETHLCVNPEHMHLMTRGKLAQELGALGLMSGLVRSAAIARTKRKTHAKLTSAQAKEIRASTETGVVMSKKYGVSQPRISKVRLGKGFRDFESPWAGLCAS